MLEHPLARYLLVFIIRILVAMAAAYILITSPGFGIQGAVVFFLIAYPASKLHEDTPDPYNFRSIIVYFLICFIPMYIIILGFSGGMFFDSLISKKSGGVQIVQNGDITFDAHINFFVTVFAAALVYCVGFLFSTRYKRPSSQDEKP